MSRDMGDYLAQAIPKAELHFAPGQGHLNVGNWDDIFAACRIVVERDGLR